MIHAAMEPAQLVSDVQIKSLLEIQSHIIRASQKNWSLQGMDGFHGVWLVDSCKALNAPNMEGLQKKTASKPEHVHHLYPEEEFGTLVPHIKFDYCIR